MQEIELPTEGYNNVSDLFSENENGETGLCFLGSLVAKDYTDEEYEELAYYVAKIIDNTIDSSEYPFPQVEYTAKNRRSIGVGITNLAHLMAKNGVKYDTEEGRNFVHKVAERHSYFMHKASTRLAKERGKCGWIHKTKYNEGWLPIDTYSKGVDKWHTQELQYDWEALRGEIKEHGVRFSVLEAFMPTESSSLLTNSTAGLYGVRSLDIFKQSRKGGVYFQVPEIDELKDNYQFVWDVDNLDWAKFYGIVQKFCGQGISADFYHDFGKQPSVSANDMIKLMLLSAQVGMKSWYYLNFKVQASSTTGLTIDDEENCDSCTL